MFALLQRFLSNFSAQFLTLISIHSKAVIIHSTPSWRVDQLRMDSRSPSNKFYFAPSFLGDHLYFSFMPSIFMVSFELLTSSMKGNLLPVTVQLRSNSQYCGVFPDFELHLTSWRAERCCCVISGRHLTLASGFATNEGSYVSSSSDIQFSYC